MAYTFQPDDSRFGYSKAAAMLRAASLAYERDGEALAKTLRADFGSVDVVHFRSPRNPPLHRALPDFKLQDTQGYLAADADKIILAFRGTEGIETGESFLDDWSSDALFQQARFNQYFPSADEIGSIHAGFGKALRDVWKKVRSELKRLRLAYPAATLWITGHSLGGAIALLAATACYYETEHQTPVTGLYTFGQPRVGNLVFRTFFETALGARTYFIVNNGDLVTRVPPRSFPCVPGLNYATTGRLVFLRGGRATNDFTSWQLFTQTEIVGWQHIARVGRSIGEHFTSSYLASITAAQADIEAMRW